MSCENISTCYWLGGQTLVFRKRKYPEKGGQPSGLANQIRSFSAIISDIDNILLTHVLWVLSHQTLSFLLKKASLIFFASRSIFKRRIKTPFKDNGIAFKEHVRIIRIFILLFRFFPGVGGPLD